MKQPNILFFLADQHRYDCTGYAGKYPVATPNIDAVGREGVCFTNAYCPTPVCAPARQSFLSGRRAEAIGALHNFNFIETKTLMPEDFHLIKGLKSAGYTTSFVGKWDGSVRPAEEFGIDKICSHRDYNAYIKQKYPDVKYTNSWFGEHSPIPLEDSRTHWHADRAIEQIKEFSADEKPWFIWIDGTDPHLPCHPSSPFFEQYKPEDAVIWDGFGDRFIDKPYIQRQQILNWRLENMTWENWAPTVVAYYAMISQVDDSFGRVIDALKESGQYDNTLVIYTSDHGDMSGSHGMIDKHYNLWDDVIRIPLVMRLPGKIEPGTVCDDFASNALDLLPTLAEIAGFEVPESVVGTSLFDMENRPDCAVCGSGGQQFGAFTQRCIRTKTHKYIWNLTDIDELYDLTKDPGELHNLIKLPEYSLLVSVMRRKMKAELVRCGDPYAKTSWLNRQLDEDVKLI